MALKRRKKLNRKKSVLTTEKPLKYWVGSMSSWVIQTLPSRGETSI